MDGRIVDGAAVFDEAEVGLWIGNGIGVLRPIRVGIWIGIRIWVVIVAVAVVVASEKISHGFWPLFYIFFSFLFFYFFLIECGGGGLLVYLCVERYSFILFCLFLFFLFIGLFVLLSFSTIYGVQMFDFKR